MLSIICLMTGYLLVTEQTALAEEAECDPHFIMSRCKVLATNIPTLMATSSLNETCNPLQLSLSQTCVNDNVAQCGDLIGEDGVGILRSILEGVGYLCTEEGRGAFAETLKSPCRHKDALL